MAEKLVFQMPCFCQGVECVMKLGELDVILVFKEEENSFSKTVELMLFKCVKGYVGLCFIMKVAS